MQLELYEDKFQKRQQWYLDAIFDIVNMKESKEFKIYTRIVRGVDGAFQIVGGFGEISVGVPIAKGGFAIGNIKAVSGGVYLVADGASNMSGGASEIYNSIFDEDIDLNWMRKGYRAISPEYGEDIYNLTQIGIGLYTMHRSFNTIPDEAISVHSRAKNITRAKVEGLQTETVVTQFNNKVVITIQEINMNTSTPMILERTVIDLTKLPSSASLLIGQGVDAINVDNAVDNLTD